MNTASWDVLLNGSAASQETLLAQCEEIAAYRADYGTVFTMWRERNTAKAAWKWRVSCGDYTESFGSRAAAGRAHPALAAA